MAHRTQAIALHLPLYHQQQQDAVKSKLAPVIARLDSQGCEVIQLAGLDNGERYSVHAVIAAEWPDVVHESIGEGSARVLRLYTRCACKTALLHRSSPLRALPQALMRAIIDQGLAPPPAQPQAPPEQHFRQVHFACSLWNFVKAACHADKAGGFIRIS
jgi:hypothetical protein